MAANGIVRKNGHAEEALFSGNVTGAAGCEKSGCHLQQVLSGRRHQATEQCSKL